MHKKPIRFHWSLSQVTDKYRRARAYMTGIIDANTQIDFIKEAETYGIDSVLMAVSFARPDPLVQSVYLATQTTKMNFMIAVRGGLIQPTYFAQQINTAAQLMKGRIHINLVSGHNPRELKYYGDHQSHDQRYERSDEFMAICRAFWQEQGPANFKGTYFNIEQGQLNTPYYTPDGPEIFVGGNSAMAANLAVKHAHCLWRFPDSPEQLRPKIQTVLEAGKEVGLLVSLITRPSREEALEVATSLVSDLGEEAIEAQKGFRNGTDSHGFSSIYDSAILEKSNWITSYLWTGAVPYLGPPSIALIGSYQEIADAIMGYKKMGISQYLFMGWPDKEELAHFGKGVLPLVREGEREENKVSASATVSN